MKIMTVVGARPQFVKAAVVSREMANFNVEEKIIHTGQHYDQNMSDIFFEEMQIPKPTYSLGIGGSSHGDMTGRQLIEIEKILLQDRPDYVLVYGDTNSTLAGALAASKLHIPVAHVEAGLRSFNKKMPEELNRILTDQLSEKLFCPTDVAVKNLYAEGFSNSDNKVTNVGDVMLDASLFYKKSAISPSGLIADNEFILCTIHRAENTDNIDKLVSIVESLNIISNNYEVVFPVHPRTRNKIESLDIKINFTMLDPVSYFEMLWLLDNCRMVVTDSGGLQKEAFFFNKYCLTIRDETEWVELVSSGVNFLTPANVNDITCQFFDLISLGELKINSKLLYGDGKAASKILGNLK
ncbi:TPA: UDP-N-acetylglucosamine 2-epimerase (non-hydrolyzing) [Vibrio vulnificus]|nr:UDP-N-acetylglucosamine 2-epimerase (non-hydrolyzing) [Vibrio vulnificus]EIO3996950.1 UDP-N-acetylglucosamine 2-epimerase (non-hydrolyzing) [Vibrio vulnificus]MCU8216690.1 UDP-N-acetylglucosamine 2-epimerase (non-hydrolyzing) [Vibrio vulnificus]HAS6178825.1 UDP-N-acetylglucosamine 2-epimerase (non-hydrolyzing) [Vibrio vulnificus]HAS6223896.1 UDP-N-acetylglucosamine 2-epimerase (non-hydrolyzing) [Vibrio vulnificus]